MGRIGKQHRIVKSRLYAENVQDAASLFSIAAAENPIDYPVDMHLIVSIWKRIDTDACVKGIMDALEKGGVLKDDKMVRDILITREYHSRDHHDVCTVELYATGADRWTTS
jgi:Holliday junction resolvase RusA-like endonuclease